MRQLSALLTLFLLILAGCQAAASSVSLPPTAVPFPTMTPGQVLRGVMPTVLPPSAQDVALANPATAIALVNQPTPTPNYGACPAVGSAELEDLPVNDRAIPDAITRFLSAGGAPATLESALRSDWNIMGEAAVFQDDFDLTGEGSPELLLTYTGPNDGGALLILGCANGRYVTRYEAAPGGSTPQVIQIGDLNYDNQPDVLYTNEQCVQAEGEDEPTCRYVSQLITWRGRLGRFVSLLDRLIESEDPPQVSDVDNDQVGEIVVRLDNPGDSTTGPLRTGVNIYDWNGAAYVRSIVQLDPPRFRIQVIHEADRAFSRLNAEAAIPLYELALNAPNLEAWRSDEGDILQAYARYRLLMAYAYVEDDRLLDTYQAIVDTYPDPAAAPVYVEMATAFWNALQVTNNLRSACIEVREVIERRPEALDLLNRYGSRSPVYDANLVCPL